jgi:hypothetical protein
MKVAVTLSLDVDSAAWDQTYGTGTQADVVRDDVRQYVLSLAQESAAAQERGIRSVELRAGNRS